MSLRNVAGKPYWVEIDGSGPTILFLHGLGGTSNVYQPLLDVLSKKNTLIRVDLEGHGNSPMTSSKLSIDQWADDIEALLDDLSIEVTGVVAHSAGCLVALCLAQRNPQRFNSMALLGPVFGHSDASRQALRNRSIIANSEGLSKIAIATISSLSEQTRQVNPLAAPLIRELILRQTPMGYAAACVAVADTPVYSPSTFNDVRFLLVTGDADPVSTPATSTHFAEGLANVHCEQLVQCGHWPTIEKPLDVVHLLSHFFNADSK